MRIATVLAVALLSTTSLAGAEHAQAAIQHYQLNIPRQSLDTALKDLAQQTGLQIGRFSGRIDGSAMVGPVLGDQTPAQALKTLLNNTGLEYKIVSDTMIAVYNPKDATSAQSNARLNGSEEAAGGEASSGSSDDANTSKEAGKKSSQDFRVAQVDQGANSQSSAVGSNVSGTQENENKGGLAEIVVTAQKREQRLQDVPVPVTAISADTLVENGQTAFSDYSNQIPGLTGTQMGPAVSAVSIRGITTGLNSNPTVGYTIDDVPVGGSTNAGGGFYVPEINPADLAQIEVLRGPQGTLYGANSMGGLIKYVTVEPSVESVSGSVQAGTNDVYNGAEPGYNVSGAVNVPLGADLAVRASAFSRQDAGYIDNVLTGQRGVNERWVDGARLAALWQISPAFQLKVNALLQGQRADGPNEIDMPTAGYAQTAELGNLQQTRIAGSGGSTSETQFYDAVLTGTVGSVNLASITSYSHINITSIVDYSSIFGSIAQSDYGVSGVLAADYENIDKATQELRLSGSISQFEWLLGGFFDHETAALNIRESASDSKMGVIVGPVGSLFNYGAPADYEEEAGFVDLTWKVNSRFDIQFGGRQSHLTESEPLTGNYACGALLGGVCSTIPASPPITSANPFTYLVTPSYKLSPDMMVYFRAASGYRPGGGVDNPPPGSLCLTEHVPCAYGPDKTQNYEFGAKGDFLEHHLTIDSSLFYIDWKGLQLTEVAPSGFNFTGNGNAAKSEGVELSMEARPFTGFTISGWVDWDEAVLTHDLSNKPATDYGVSGDRLPYSARWSGNLSVQQEFPLNNEVTGFVGAKEIYVGDRVGEFTDSPTRTDLPSYTETDLLTGIRRHDWTLNVYANNVADRRGLLYGGLVYQPPYAFGIIPPRTIGVTVTKTF